MCYIVGVLGWFRSGIRLGFTSQVVICSTVRPTLTGCPIISTGTDAEKQRRHCVICLSASDKTNLIIGLSPTPNKALIPPQ